jgi:hypothetical protein
MGDYCVVSTGDAPCDSDAFQHNFQVFVAHRCELCRKFPVLLESPERHSLLVAVIPRSHWLVLNTTYSIVFRCPHSPKSRGLKSGDRGGQLIHSTPKVWSRCCLTRRRKWGGALSCMNHMCYRWLRGTCSKSTGKSFIKHDGTLHMLMCYVWQLVLTIDHLKCSSR